MMSEGRNEGVFALLITLPVVCVVGIMFVGRSCKNFGEVLLICTSFRLQYTVAVSVLHMRRLVTNLGENHCTWYNNMA